jgi:hypothetical protein
LKEGIAPTPSAEESKSAAKKTSSENGASSQELKNLLTLSPQKKDLEQNERAMLKTGRTRGPASLRAPDDSSNASAKTPSGQVSATDDYLEDVAIGVNTLLNTKEFVFYSFYERIREKLNHTWRLELDNKLEQIFARGQNLNYDRKTKVEVNLDSGGQIKDQAAVNAFRQAAPFPNPPKGMLDNANDKVSLRWDFVVIAGDSGPRVKMEVRRAPANF